MDLSPQSQSADACSPCDMRVFLTREANLCPRLHRVGQRVKQGAQKLGNDRVIISWNYTNGRLALCSRQSLLASQGGRRRLDVWLKGLPATK